MAQADAISMLLGRLETAFPDVKWDRDALDMASENQTGAVELVSRAVGYWADGHLVDEDWLADIWMLIDSSGAAPIAEMNDVLTAFDNEVVMIGWDAPERHFLYDLGKVSWRWRVRFYQPILMDGGADPDGQEGQEGQEAPDGQEGQDGQDAPDGPAGG